MPRVRIATVLVVGLVAVSAVLALFFRNGPKTQFDLMREAAGGLPRVVEPRPARVGEEDDQGETADDPAAIAQQADPDFDTSVARPAYTAADPPRVLFDEAHHNFHTAGGRYRPFAELIANDGYLVIPSAEAFTPELLARGDILVVANARGAAGWGPDAAGPAFSEAECYRVRDWVRAGGSLLLITDHTPFGAAASPLARRFGVHMGLGMTTDPSNSEDGVATLNFTRENQLLGDHPILDGRDETERVDRVRTFTGQSLAGPEGSAALLRLGATAVDEADDGQPTPAAGRAQAVALTFGAGRVVVLGEAAVLSAQVDNSGPFGMNVPGLDNRQLALNIMHWLSALLEPRGGLQQKTE